MGTHTEIQTCYFDLEPLNCGANVTANRNLLFLTAYLKEGLISLVQLFLHDFTTVTVGICACYTLELRVCDAVDTVHQKNMTTCVQSLHCQLLISSQ